MATSGLSSDNCSSPSGSKQLSTIIPLCHGLTITYSLGLRHFSQVYVYATDCMLIMNGLPRSITLSKNAWQLSSCPIIAICMGWSTHNTTVSINKEMCGLEYEGKPNTHVKLVMLSTRLFFFYLFFKLINLFIYLQGRYFVEVPSDRYKWNSLFFL